MEPEVVASTTNDAFDAAVTSASTYVEPTGADSADNVSAARDAKGRFAASEKSAGELDEIPTPDDLTAEDLAEKRRDLGQDASDRAAEKRAEAASRRPRNDPQARIDQIVKEREDARREAAKYKAELDAARAPREAPKPVAADAAPDATDAAKYPGGEYDPKYLDDRSRFVAVEAIRAEQAAAHVQAEDTRKEREFDTKAQSFVKRASEASAIESIDRRLLSGKPLSLLTSKDRAGIAKLPPQEQSDLGFICFLADQWNRSEHDVALVKYLSDPAVFQRLATLPPDQVIWELARVEAGLAAAPHKDVRGSAPKPSASQANPPIKPLGATSHAVADDDGSEDESLDKFISRENAKDRKSGRL
jgi:hypothetical protein